jgi:hypothetical protein
MAGEPVGQTWYQPRHTIHLARGRESGITPATPPSGRPGHPSADGSATARPITRRVRRSAWGPGRTARRRPTPTRAA